VYSDNNKPRGMALLISLLFAVLLSSSLVGASTIRVALASAEDDGPNNQRWVMLWAVPTNSRIDDGHYQLLSLLFRLDMINSIDKITITLEAGTPLQKVLEFKADGTKIVSDPAFAFVVGGTTLTTDGDYYAIGKAKGRFIIAIDKTKLVAGDHSAIVEVMTDIGKFTDHAVFKLRPAEANLADLVAKFLASPNSMKIGKKHNVQALESNEGDAEAHQHKVSIYLSTDSILDNTDIKLGFAQVDHLKKDQSKIVPIKFEIPSSASPGAAHLILKVDSDNEVPESNENNNTLVKAITLTAGSNEHGQNEGQH